MSRVHPFCGVASRTVCGSAEGNVTGQVLAELCWTPKGSCKRAATVSSTAAAVAAGVRFRSHTWLRRRMQSARAAATTPHWSLSWSRLLGLDTDCRSSPRSYQARLRKVTLRESTTRAGLQVAFELECGCLGPKLHRDDHVPWSISGGMSIQAGVMPVQSIGQVGR